tara:strand:+ start:31 stop:369 length:339 start_codon:yes stop_codon:yes gene_type:complete
MAVDTNKKYFFHNVYGDAQTLLDTKADDIVSVAWGYDADTETARNNYINDLGITPSCLPSLIYYKPSWNEDTYLNDVLTTQTHAATWVELRFKEIDKSNWNWAYINNLIGGN